MNNRNPIYYRRLSPVRGRGWHHFGIVVAGLIFAFCVSTLPLFLLVKQHDHFTIFWKLGLFTVSLGAIVLSIRFAIGYWPIIYAFLANRYEELQILEKGICVIGPFITRTCKPFFGFPGFGNTHMYMADHGFSIGWHEIKQVYARRKCLTVDNSLILQLLNGDTLVIVGRISEEQTILAIDAIKKGLAESVDEGAKVLQA